MKAAVLALCAGAAALAGCRTNRPKRDPHRFEYSTQGGPELGPGLHEIDTSLRVDYAKNEAFLERHQPVSDEGGEPLGTFRGPLADKERNELLAACAAVPLSSVPPGNRGGPGVSQIRLVDTNGERISQAAFSSRDIASIQQADPILSVANDLVGALADHPFQAVTLKVHHHAGLGGGSFEIELVNVGTQTVAVPDLRMLGSLGTGYQQQGLGVRVAEFPPEKPGYTAPPLEWSVLPIASTKADAPPLSLAPGAALTAATVPWASRKHGMRHLVQAIYSFHGEPIVVYGHLMMRGRALSQALEVTP